VTMHQLGPSLSMSIYTVTASLKVKCCL